MLLQQDLICESRAKTISYVANSYAKMAELSDVDQRLTLLENKVLQKGP